jgi:hypothetical protein
MALQQMKGGEKAEGKDGCEEVEWRKGHAGGGPSVFGSLYSLIYIDA